MGEKGGKFGLKKGVNLGEKGGKFGLKGFIYGGVKKICPPLKIFSIFAFFIKILFLMNTEMTDKIAKIDNTFILNAQYRMTAKEQKVLYYLISHLNPKNEKDFNIITVPTQQIVESFKESSKKWGSIYEEIERLCDSLIGKRIKFPTDILIDGKALNGRINFFSSIRPTVEIGRAHV